jgi:hypothetical protein
LVLLDEFVEVRAEQLKDEAQMRAVDERVAQSQDVVLVVRIRVFVQL